MTQRMREKFASKLTWLEKKQKNPGLPDSRKQPRQRDAVGVIQQAAVVRLWNQSAGSAAGFFMLPAIRC
jgi:hypothetical protein